MKVREVIDTILTEMCGETRIEPTCDIMTAGDPENEVTGIVTTFMATADVIRKAASIGANFIVTHEPTWFTGMDDTAWCKNDRVYLAKKELIDELGITIWRLHDHMHFGSSTDYIYKGLLKELDWYKYLQPDEKEPWVYVIPETSVRELAEYVKERLEMETVQIIGSPDMKVKRVGILVGGGSLGFGKEEMPMEVIERNDLDLMMVGDITEWTICAYINDAYQMGMNKAMLTLGHERSEEAGMKYMAPWIQERVGDIPVTFVDAREPFTYL